MTNILTDKILTEHCPTAHLGVLKINVKVAPSSDELLELIDNELVEVAANLKREDIAKIPSLQATRQAYKALGKDPSRYRPSAEALLRRVTSGKGLYRVNNVVDILNLISVKTGYSIGGYDFDKINGAIRWGRGAADEPYEAIGRGALNIEGLPVLRDETGAFGSPTSDSTRTMVTEETQVFLVVVFGFGAGEEKELNDVVEVMERLIPMFVR